MLRTHTCGQLRKTDIGTQTTLCGWVNNRRDHGGIIFVDLRDKYGITQIVFDPQSDPAAHKLAESVRSEWVLCVKGHIRHRGDGLENPRLDTGDIEVITHELEVLSESKTPPFEIDSQEEIREDLRMQYRYLDLRKPKMQQNLALRHNMVKVIRDYFDKGGFLEIETPILVKGTPEGSREYLVPSRIHPGNFYVLPQSPQQLKQLLMVGGVDKYFQVARCFRDEDLRGDRQPEFTQFEIEMSFVEQEDIISVIEGCFHELTKKCAPGKNWESYLENGKFKRMTWQSVMEKYGSDKPDIRFDMSFTDLTEDKAGCGFGVFESCERLFCMRVEDGTKLSRKDIDDLTDLARKHGAGGLAWVRVGEDSGPVMKNSKPEFLATLVQKTGSKEGDLIFFGAGDFLQATEPLGQVRLAVGDKFGLRNPDDFAYLWVTDFPMFEKKEDGTIQAAHHPFTMPYKEDRERLKSDPMSVKAYAYDVVLNGVELGGGSVRIHDQHLQHSIFEVFGMDEDEIQLKFGHMLKAFQYGCPPHGGCAMGLDRVVMLFAGEPNIREVIAFPKNQSAQDMMLGAPSPMPEKQLTEQHIKIVEEE
ncbi:MAG TPA: aspartate--tRNA ligase [Candidatus Gracilibacteria bacterium]